MSDVIPIGPRIEKRKLELEVMAVIDAMELLGKRSAGTLDKEQFVDEVRKLNIDLKAKIAAARAAGAMK